MADAQFRGTADRSRRNAAIAWATTLVLAVLAVNHGLGGSYRWVAFTGIAVVIVVSPAAVRREPLAMPPWELLLLVLVSVVDATMFG